MSRFVLVNVVPAQPQQCFALSLSVDAHTESMSDSGERAVGGVTSGGMTLGDTVTWRATHFGIPFAMTSQITEFEAPFRFVDEQVSGPFRTWWHEHRFETVPEGTRMSDVVEFESPAGPIGRAVNVVLLNRYLKHLLMQRNRWLVGALSSAGS